MFDEALKKPDEFEKSSYIVINNKTNMGRIIVFILLYHIFPSKRVS